MKIFKKLFTVHIPKSTNLVSYEMISKTNDIGLITIKNSSKRNALNSEILSDLSSFFENLEQSFKEHISPRVVIITSEGPVFSSGHDLKELNSSSEERQKEIFNLCSKLMFKIQNSNCITIAEVQGLATAAGCQLAATCDLVVASSNAKFETPGVKIGLFCSTPSVALSRVISPKRAMYMLVTGEPIDVKTAKKWGLVNRSVDCESREKLREVTLGLAEQINQFSGETLSFGKKVFYSQIGEDNIEDAYRLASVSMCSNFKFRDAKEGIRAFLEKRKPEFNKKI
jgi:enoyl-CoA hydratase/carnithine racemase